MHHGAYEWVRKIVLSLPPIQGRVAEFGSRNVNGSVRPLFAGASLYFGIDLMRGEEVDLVADAADWFYPGLEGFDAVVSCEMLEHAPRAREVCHNAYRLLRAGGVFIITAASPGREPHSVDGVHPVPPGEHYANISPAELRDWLSPFRTVLIDAHSTPDDIYAFAAK